MGDMAFGDAVHHALLFFTSRLAGCASVASAAGPPIIEASWARDVHTTSASLEVAIDSNGFSTKFRFEYISDARFQANRIADPLGDGFEGASVVVLVVAELEVAVLPPQQGPLACRGGRRQAPDSPRASTPMFSPSARAVRSTMSSWTVSLPASSWPMTLRLTPIESARSSWVRFSPRWRSRIAAPRAEAEFVGFIAIAPDHQNETDRSHSGPTASPDPPIST